MAALALLALLIAPSAASTIPESDSATADKAFFGALGGSPFPGQIARPAPVSERAEPARRRAYCPRPVVWIDQWKSIFKEGLFLGANAVSYDTSCTGLVLWLDGNRNLYRDATPLGSDARHFEVEDYSGTVVWLDGNSGLHKNERWLGGPAVSFAALRGSGKVFWLDAYGGLFRDDDDAPIASNARSFEVFEPGGRVVWTDRFGQRHIAR